MSRTQSRRRSEETSGLDRGVELHRSLWMVYNRSLLVSIDFIGRFNMARDHKKFAYKFHFVRLDFLHSDFNSCRLVDICILDWRRTGSRVLS